MNEQKQSDCDVMAINENCRMLVLSMMNKNFPSIPQNIALGIASVVSSWISSLIVGLQAESMDYVRELLLIYAKDMVGVRLMVNQQLPWKDVKDYLPVEKVEELGKIISSFTSKKEDLLRDIDAAIRIELGVNLKLGAR